MKYLWILLFCTSACSTELIPLINQLGYEDFEVREAATAELAKLPKEYAYILRKLAESYRKDDLEIAMRLEEASEKIFINEILYKNKRWRHLIGFIGIDSKLLYEWHYREEGDAQQTEEGLRVTFVHWEGPAYEKLENEDVIIKINDKIVKKYVEDLQGSGFFEYDTTIKFTVKRYKDKDRAFNEDYTDNEFTLLDIKVPVIHGKPSQLNEYALQRAYKEIWAEFLISYGKFSAGKDF